MNEIEMKKIPRIYIRKTIPQNYIDKMKKLGAELIIEPWQYGDKEQPPKQDISECNIVLTLGLHDTLAITKIAPQIEWVQSLSVGLEALLHKEVIENSIIVTNTKGCTSVPIAEHTIAMISGLARGIPYMIRNQLKKAWEPTIITDLSSSTVGIIGYGEIGKEIAKRCKALNMTVIGCKKRPEIKRFDEPADYIVGLNEIDNVIKKSDFLVLALPSTKETHHLFSMDKLKLMKKTSFLINIGRGNIIVEEDLITILKENRIAGAALDVFDLEPLPNNHELWDLDNVIISPHNAYFSPKTMDSYMELFIENINRFMNGQKLLNIVDKKLGY